MSTKQGVVIWAGVLGVAGVALGAFGAHALKERLMAGGYLETWRTAVQYHLLHAVALLALGALPPVGAAAAWAGRCWVAGVALFSGSLYGLCLGGPRWLGPVTPLGGLLLMAGWALVIVAAAKSGGERNG